MTCNYDFVNEANRIKAISSPLRLKVLCNLLDGEKSVVQLQHLNPGVTQGNMSFHLKILLQNDYVRAKSVGSCSFYSLVHEEIRDMLMVIQNVYCLNRAY